MSKAAKKMAHPCHNYKTGKDPTDRLTVVWNKIQTKFECCGINSYQDWKNSTFGKAGIIPIYNQGGNKHFCNFAKVSYF